MTYVVMGLGNPGDEYLETRHNAGSMALSALLMDEDVFNRQTLSKSGAASVVGGTIGDEKVKLVWSDVFMNQSGKAALPFIKSVKAAQKLLVLRDDLDLPLGVIKMTYGRGSGGHKGVESIMRAIKTKDFYQIKIGISGTTPKGKTKKPAGEEKVVKHVIGKFSPKEKPELKKILDKTVNVIRLFVEEGPEKATMEANTR